MLLQPPTGAGQPLRASWVQEGEGDLNAPATFKCSVCGTLHTATSGPELWGAVAALRQRTGGECDIKQNRLFL